MIHNDTIVALATPSGPGAIAIIRLSGKDAIKIASLVFNSVHGKKLADQKTHTVHLGNILDGERIIDEVLATLFKNPQSYTGENVVEFSCHGSSTFNRRLFSYYSEKVAEWLLLENLLCKLF